MPTQDEEADALFAHGRDNATGGVATIAQRRANGKMRRQLAHDHEHGLPAVPAGVPGIAQGDLIRDGHHVDQFHVGVLGPAEVIGALDQSFGTGRIGDGDHDGELVRRVLFMVRPLFEDAYDEGGYESGAGTNLAKGAGELVIDRALKLLAQIQKAEVQTARR